MAASRGAMLTPAERSLERRRMATALANLEAFAVFWSPRFRRLICRSVVCVRHFAIPQDALLVGVFERPATSAEIVAELEELLASRSQAAHAAAHREEACDG